MNAKVTKTRIGRRWVIILMMVLVAVGCCLAPLVFLIARDLDRETCIPRVAHKLGVEPTSSAIYKYILVNATPGMTRDEVQLVLEKIGPVIVVDSIVLSDYAEVQDVIRLTLCSHPMNDIVVLAFYSMDGKLATIRIDAD